MSKLNMPATNEPAIVTCVEAGPLEAQVLLMVESLRRWGGRLADAPVLAVKPRWGPALRRATRRRFDELGVEFVDVRHRSRFGWYKFLNKPIAVKVAAERFDAETICWLDADILVIREPTELLLRDDEDFVANCSDLGGLASTGPGCEHEPYWRRACDLIGVDIEQMPWLIPHRGPGEPVRFYFNGGVFAFRRDTGFADAYIEAVEKLLAARFAHPQHRCYFHEQAALGLVALKLGLGWRELTARSNFATKAMLGPHEDETADATVLHYHGGLHPSQFSQFKSTVQRFHPEVGEWLERKGPLADDWPAAGIAATLVNFWRKARQELYLKRCCIVQDESEMTGRPSPA